MRYGHEQSQIACGHGKQKDKIQDNDSDARAIATLMLDEIVG